MLGARTSFHRSASILRFAQRTRSVPGFLGAVRWHGGPEVAADAPTIHVSFLLPNGETKEVTARVGETLLQTAHRNEVDLEGACEGGMCCLVTGNIGDEICERLDTNDSLVAVCACSTCHLILPTDMYNSLPEPSEDEEDMLE